MRHKNRIIVVDDELTNLEAIVDTLILSGYSVEAVSNGILALEKINQIPYTILLTDLVMPEMSGEELIDNILATKNPPLVIVQTVVTDLERVLNLMRKGVYDYITKPFTSQELLHRIKLAIEVAELRKVSKFLEEERQLRLQEQLDWNIWKEKRIKGESKLSSGSLISSLRTSFSQASGFGSLIAALKLVKSKAILENEKYVLPKNLMDIVFENYDTSYRFIQFLEEIDSIITSGFELEDIKLNELQIIIQKSIDKMERYSSIKSHTIKFAKLSSKVLGYKIRGNKNYLARVIEEILFNAFKFSKQSSTVYIILELQNMNLKISILSEPKLGEGEDYSIPDYMQNIIFEPFYRATKHVFEEYPTYDYGIGLAFVDLVIQKHKGKVTSYMVKSHLNPESTSDMVNIEIELPYES